VESKVHQQQEERENMVPLDGPFTFACNPSVPCFKECCRDLDLILTPYDILRLRQNLGLSSDAFVEKYVVWDFSHDMGFPTAKLKMSDDEKKLCPFLGEAGCEVYEDRPSACRIYPLARATQKHARFERTTDAYFLVRESHCRGFEQGKEWTIEEWIKDQGLEIYFDMNDLWTAVVCSPFKEKRGKLSDRDLKAVLMAAYNLEMFKQFVFKSSLLDRIELDSERVDKMKRDEAELLKFGFDWLRFALFGESTIKLSN